jgi:hypothetical protein
VLLNLSTVYTPTLKAYFTQSSSTTSRLLLSPLIHSQEMPSLHKALSLYTKEERKEIKQRETERQAEREVGHIKVMRRVKLISG